MEIVLEIIFEVFFEGIIEIIQNKKISKWIRYPLGFLFGLFYGVLLFLFFLFSLKCFLKNKIIVGFFFLGVGLLLLIFLILIFKKTIKKD